MHSMQSDWLLVHLLAVVICCRYIAFLHFVKCFTFSFWTSLPLFFVFQDVCKLHIVTILLMISSSTSTSSAEAIILGLYTRQGACNSDIWFFHGALQLFISCSLYINYLFAVLHCNCRLNLLKLTSVFSTKFTGFCLSPFFCVSLGSWVISLAVLWRWRN